MLPGFCKAHAHLPNPLEKKLRLDLVLKGIKRGKPVQKDTRLPITPMILRAVRRELAKSPDLDSKMLWAAVCIGFFGFMRTGEFTPTAGLLLLDMDMSKKSLWQQVSTQLTARAIPSELIGATTSAAAAGIPDSTIHEI